MKFMQRWNERTRLMLTLELAVVLPVAALIGVSIHYLWSIQRDRAVEAAIERDFSQVLAISEKQINEKAYSLLDDIHMELPTSEKACSVDLDRILAHHPYVAHVYVYYPESGLIFRSQPDRMQEAGFREEGAGLNKMMDGWMKIGFEQMVQELQSMHKKGKPYFEPNWAPRRDNKRVYQSMGMFLGKLDSGEKYIGGMVFDAEYLRNEFFPEALDSVMSRNLADSQGDRSHPVMMIHPQYESTPIAASAGWDGGEPEVERNLEGAFPHLTLAMKMRGTTLAAMGKHFALTSYGILGGSHFCWPGVWR